MKVIEKYYKYLHENPELSGEEYSTRQFIIEVLSKYNCELYSIGLSLICYFDKGRSGSVAFRSELDALPIEECMSNYPRSKNSNMHACGHDVHTASLLKLAKEINDNDFKYNMCLIFQSSEESGAGSKEIVNSNILVRLNVINVIGVHVWPNLERGRLFSAHNLMYGSYELDVNIYGICNHISSYDETYDSTYASFLLYNEIRKFDGDYTCHLGKLCSGSARNVSSDKAVMKYSIRFKNDKSIKDKIEDISIDTNCTIEYNFISEYPPLINDIELLSNFNYCDINTLKSAEDFGYYGVPCKICFMLYGLGKGNNLHSNNFNVDYENRSNYYETLKLILDKYIRVDKV